MRKVAALYVETNGTYFGLRGVDPWDEHRDAMLYDGDDPVIAHPPCARWSMLAYSIQARYGYEVGDDGGTFAHALATVRRYGGVLEHPSRSLAFGSKVGFSIGRPRFGSWQKLENGGYITEVSQAAYGHLADKLTWLLYYGKRPPPKLDWSTPRTEYQISYGKKRDGHYWKKPLTKAEGKRTPPAFRDLLIGMARSCDGSSYHRSGGQHAYGVRQSARLRRAADNAPAARGSQAGRRKGAAMVTVRSNGSIDLLELAACAKSRTGD